MRVSSINNRVPGSVSCLTTPCGLEMETVMRIRPLLKKERDDVLLLEAQEGDRIVVFNPLDPFPLQQQVGSSMRCRAFSDSTAECAPKEYRFNHVLNESTTQDKMFNTLGLSIVHTAMKSLKNTVSTQIPKSHLLISMGVENSGKSYTCFGGMTISKRRSSEDGLVPRLLDSLFSQSAHAGGNSNRFTVQVSIMQITQPNGGRSGNSNSCQVYDLLANKSSPVKTKMFGKSPMKKKNLNVKNIAARFERAIPSPVGRKPQKLCEDTAVLDAENLKPTVQNCRDITHAREVLQTGLNASQKLTTGNKKCHLYITMQPVVDDSKFGDRISILDMASLEKEDSMQNTRGNGSIASNMNQIASANNAVLNCLRVLTHNAKISNRKVNGGHGIVDHDDDYSEISSVSRANLSTNDQMKPVPFRHHKVTMLMNSIIEQSSFVNVTLLVTAYPGHVDFQQKRNLLNEVEKLHGSTLVVHEDAEMARETMNLNIGTKVDNRVKQRMNFENKGVTIASAPFEEESSSDPHPSSKSNRRKFQSRDSIRKSMNVVPGAPRMAKVVSVHNPRSTCSSKKPIASAIVRTEPVKMSRGINSRVEVISQVPRHEIEHLPSSENHMSAETSIQPSASAMAEVQQPRLKSTKMREKVTDFPGVHFSQSAETESRGERYPIATRSPRNSRNRRKALSVGTEQENSLERRGCKAMLDPEPEAKQNFEKLRQEELISPLGRSRLENSEYSTTGNQDKIQDHSHTEITEKQLNAKELPPNWFETGFTNFDSKPEDKKENPTKNLEAKLKKALQEKQALEQICTQLEKENAELKNAVREAGRKALQSKWTQQDEEDFQASRRLRQEAQSKIKHPIHEHLERVNYIYDIKNQYLMTNKQHFSLSFPDHFQRAPILDMRDKNNEDTEFSKFETSEKQRKEETVVKNPAVANNRRASLTQARLSPPKRLPPPPGLTALRRLTGKTSQ